MIEPEVVALRRERDEARTLAGQLLEVLSRRHEIVPKCACVPCQTLRRADAQIALWSKEGT